MGLCADYVGRTFGCVTDSPEKTVHMTAGVVQRILLNNPNRLGWTIINLNTGIVFAGFTGKVSATNGFQFAASGGWKSVSCRDEGEMPTRELWAVAPTADSDLYIFETIGVKVVS